MSLPCPNYAQQAFPDDEPVFAASDACNIGRLSGHSEYLSRRPARRRHPDHKQTKLYLVQVAGIPDIDTLVRLRASLNLVDFITQSAEVKRVEEPSWLWPRTSPILARADIPTSWLVIILPEEKNRQVRRMTGAVDFPTLRLIRIGIGPISLQSHSLWPGEWQEISASELGLGNLPGHNS